MGEFSAGKWLIGLTIYFVTLFLIVFNVVAGSDGLTTANNNITNIDANFGQYQANNLNVTSGESIQFIDNTASGDMGHSDIKKTLSIITGINSSKFNIGINPAFMWIFIIFFFWIEFFAFLWAVYMALPLLH